MTALDLINLRTLASKWYAESANHSTTAIRLRADHMLESARSHRLKAETLLSAADQLTAEILTLEHEINIAKAEAALHDARSQESKLLRPLRQRAEITQDQASPEPPTPVQPPLEPTPATPYQTSVWTRLGRQLLAGLLDPEFRQEFPNYYARPRPHYAPDTGSLESTIRSAALNAASALCWPIAQTLSRLLHGPAVIATPPAPDQPPPPPFEKMVALANKLLNSPDTPEPSGRLPRPARNAATSQSARPRIDLWDGSEISAPTPETPADTTPHATTPQATAPHSLSPSSSAPLEPSPPSPAHKSSASAPLPDAPTTTPLEHVHPEGSHAASPPAFLSVDTSPHPASA